jgi:hypothetical protein
MFCSSQIGKTLRVLVCVRVCGEVDVDAGEWVERASQCTHLG